MKKDNKGIIIAIIAIVMSVVGVLLPLICVLFMTFIIPMTSKPIVYDSIDKYDYSIGNGSEYSYKWGMSEEIFPSRIKESYDVKNFKFVYYNPWDANYLALLEIEYDEEEYDKEIARLEEIGIERFRGFYGAEGFSDYELIAMEADSYNGFIYALTDGENKIIYVELIFCNYIMDIDYESYIPKDYLPDGFNAKDNNPYRDKMMNYNR